MLFARVTNKAAGYPLDQKAVSDLNPNDYFEVSAVRMSQSSTSFNLVDDDNHYNSVNFSFYKEVDGQFIEHNIYNDPQYNPYLSRVVMQKFD